MLDLLDNFILSGLENMKRKEGARHEHPSQRGVFDHTINKSPTRCL